MLKVVGIGESHWADYDHAVSSPDIEIEQITPNVYAFPGIRGCDPSPWSSPARAPCSSTPPSGSPSWSR